MTTLHPYRITGRGQHRPLGLLDEHVRIERIDGPDLGEALGLYMVKRAQVNAGDIPTQASVSPHAFWTLARKYQARVEFEEIDGLMAYQFIRLATSAGPLKLIADPAIEPLGIVVFS